MDTLNLAQASTFLHMHREEVRKRAKQGRLPAAKIGRAWVFLEDDLVDFIRANYSESRQALQVTLRKEQASCHSTNAAIPGGSDLQPRQESELDALLKQVTKNRRKISTTS
ncbi:helix-turn-helix domain-containing protein [Massilia sp. TWR1-2-2]|uniref:helix-turn-helix domain-containing protein n=1 Tax=Massilia sp. TWR1-2-2 TaxID=2804584 RepID=UPI003CF726C5